jgi:hypothetical protein
MLPGLVNAVRPAVEAAHEPIVGSPHSFFGIVVAERHALRCLHGSRPLFGCAALDHTTDDALKQPNEGRRPSQHGRVNEHASDREQKV